MTQSEQRNEELHERELHRLCDTGFHFKVQRRVRRRGKGLRRIFSKGVSETEELTFEVFQPTLATLDRMSVYMLRFHRFEQQLKEAEGDDIRMGEILKGALTEARNMAKILANMVLGELYYVYDDRTHTYKRDDAELKRLEQIFFISITPSRLYDLCNTCLAMANLGDFMNSIRLMAAEEVASPRQERIE